MAVEHRSPEIRGIISAPDGHKHDARVHGQPHIYDSPPPPLHFHRPRPAVAASAGRRLLPYVSKSRRLLLPPRCPVASAWPSASCILRAMTTAARHNEATPLLNTTTATARTNAPSASTTPATPRASNHHHFPGWGTYNEHIRVDDAALAKAAHALDSRRHPHEMLGPLQASSICGNDILSSCFYSLGLVTSYAGQLAPLCFLMVGLVLYLFRSVYGEAITAIPVNGGTYTLLINTSSKAVAAAAACLSVLAYIATGVVSAVTACNYLHAVLPDLINVPVAACCLLALFAFIVGMGLKESAGVAMVICVIHVCTLVLLLALGLVYVLFNDLGELPANLALPFPSVTITGDENGGGEGGLKGAGQVGGLEEDVLPGSLWTALLFGFAAGILGVSGFETSSQYIESQKPGVFLLTLKYMQQAVCLFNPLLSLLSIAVLPVPVVVAYSETVLEHVAHVMGDWLQAALGLGPLSGADSTLNIGRFLRIWVSLDAFVVLSGAVLTAYVGIDGLIYSMTMDGCLPSFLLTRNEWRGTDHFIILSYLLLAVSQVVLMEGDVEALAGVYAFSFLGVMALFAIGCGMLKVKRAELPREVVAPWSHVIGGGAAVILAFFVNLQSQSDYLVYFFLYLSGVGVLTLLMFQRVRLLKLLIYFATPPFALVLKKELQSLRSEEVVFFCKDPKDLYILNKALSYVRANESTVDSVLVVHCRGEGDHGGMEGGEEEEGEGAKTIRMVDQMYPAIRVSFLQVDHAFTPEVVEVLSKLLDVRKEKMMISCPDWKHRIDRLGGVRVITH